MDRSTRNQKPAARSVWQFVFRRRLPLESETALFIALSALDVVLTWQLLIRGGHYESNPIADYFIAGWGRKGMVTFKFVMVAFVCVVTQVIAHRRLEAARRVLRFAILVLGGVVVYSTILLLRSMSVV
jgi:hypothetical protein